jgi:allophanate hydrolase
MIAPDSLAIPTLLAAYRDGRYSAAELIDAVWQRADTPDEHRIWITRLARAEVMRYVAALAGHTPEELPLYGIPFVIKDNIDLAGVPTTAGCPDFAYTPTRSACVVERLIAAGAIPLGKTNLDQFATGLSGTRSPFGACRNSVQPEYVSGGSSSGSAVAVALGLASFSLGTDTAGSGRVPAAFNGLIGLKPALGRLSTRGVVPACRTLDCVSIFATTAADAARALDSAAGWDADDPYSRKLGNQPLTGLRVGMPRAEQLEFFGDRDYQRLFGAAVARLESLGGRPVELDFAPFLEAARLLYEGPWVAERYAAVGAFLDAHPDSLHPVTRRIIAGGKAPLAVDAFRAQYRLAELKRRSEAAWSQADVLITPTAGTIYTIAAMEADPVALNSNLGYYTNFMNLLDLSGVAVPAGRRADGLPFGVTFVGPAATEHALLALAGRFEAAAAAPMTAARGSDAGAAPGDAASAAATTAARVPPGYIAIAVCGAHMAGLPLNHQLTDRGGLRIAALPTAPCYRLIALPGGPPFRPGLLKVGEGGAAIDLEVWALPSAQVGSFVAGIPAPLGIGRCELADGSSVSGFICEGYAEAGATDITAFGGWRAYLNGRA